MFKEQFSVAIMFTVLLSQGWKHPQNFVSADESLIPYVSFPAGNQMVKIKIQTELI